MLTDLMNFLIARFTRLQFFYDYRFTFNPD
jgi:hypothetical protein